MSWWLQWAYLSWKFNLSSPWIFSDENYGITNIMISKSLTMCEEEFSFFVFWWGNSFKILDIIHNFTWLWRWHTRIFARKWQESPGVSIAWCQRQRATEHFSKYVVVTLITVTDIGRQTLSVVYPRHLMSVHVYMCCTRDHVMDCMYCPLD